MPRMANQMAPSGAVFVCRACGKRSRDIYGGHKISRGWDTSCSLNAILLDENSLVFDGETVMEGKLWDDNGTESPPGDHVNS